MHSPASIPAKVPLAQACTELIGPMKPASISRQNSSAASSLKAGAIASPPILSAAVRSPAGPPLADKRVADRNAIVLDGEDHNPVMRRAESP
jgi:hypothetical protein